MAIDRVARLRNAEKLLRQGKLDQAIAEYRRIVEDQPRDWNTANTLGDLYLRAGQTDKAVAEYTRIADSLSVDGFVSKAGALYKKILKIRPHDEYVLLQAAEIAAGEDLFVDARAYLNAVCELRRSRRDIAGLAAIMIRLAALDPSDYNARLASATARVELGDVEGAVAALKQLAGELTDQNRLDQAVVALREAAHFAPGDVGIKMALARLLANHTDRASVDEAARLATELTDAAVARGDWAAAVEALQQLLKQSPHDIPALLRLVEVSVDGGLPDVATSAQGQLADAYLSAGSAVDARFIADDLVARHPEDASHVERLRRALTMLGEADPDAVIANRLSGFEPLGAESHDAETTTPLESNGLEATERGMASDTVPIAPTCDAQKTSEMHSRLAAPTNEVDLSIVLEEIRPAQVFSPPSSKDLDDVFADLRQEATRRLATSDPSQELASGLAFYHSSQLDLAIPHLEAASRAPANRFAAAATLGRIFLERGQTWQAIEWLERAAETAAPTPAEGHRLLYELADALEGIGEVARALAICLELRAEAGDYQDVELRVDRLAKVQARG